MPASEKTFIGLNKWKGNEYPKRQDFVEDNEVTTDAITTFDWLTDRPGVTYEARPLDNGSYDKWIETLSRGESIIARRTSTESRDGWTVEVELTLPGKAKVSQMTTWTETGDVWKGVTA